MYDEPRRAAAQTFTNEGCEPNDTAAERGPRRGFCSELGDILLSIPAGVGVRIGG